MTTIIKSAISAFRYTVLSRSIKKEFHTKKYKDFYCAVRVRAWEKFGEIVLEYVIKEKDIARSYFLCIPVENGSNLIVYSKDEDRTLNLVFGKKKMVEGFTTLVFSEFRT